MKRHEILEQSKLYVVLDEDVLPLNELFEILKDTVRAGTTIVQLRSKQGDPKAVKVFTELALSFTKNKALFIMNDSANLAQEMQCDGVHLGQDDMPLLDARRILGPGKIIGISCQTLAQAQKAEAEGADYIGFGSVFKTQTKPGRSPMDLKLIEDLRSHIAIPVFFIGGITLENLRVVLDAGADRVAVTRAICKAQNVEKATVNFLQQIASQHFG